MEAHAGAAETFMAAVAASRQGSLPEVTIARLVGVARHKLVDHWRRDPAALVEDPSGNFVELFEPLAGYHERPRDGARNSAS